MGPNAIEIHFGPHATEHVQVFECDELLIGRSDGDYRPDLDLAPDDTVSRRHARLWQEQDTIWIEDLGSRFGTIVNEKLIAEKTCLCPHDLIEVGKTHLRISLRQATPEQPTPSPRYDVAKALDFKSHPHVPTQQMDARLKGRLELLFDLPVQFGAESDLEKLLQLIISRTVEIIPGARRGALLLVDRASGRLLLKAHVSPSVPAVSDTLAQRALHEKKGFIWRHQPEEQVSRSIDRLKIESGMYAPLLWRERSVGIICIDTPESDTIFNEDDLRFLLTVAHYAAMAVANHQQQEDLQINAKILERLLTNFSPKMRLRLLQRAQNGQLHPGGEKSEVTLLFADIRGFTSTVDGLEPEEIMEILYSYFSVLVDIIFKYDGSVDKFIGDAVFAVFGSPEPDPQQHEKAMRAAAEMQQAIAALNLERQRLGRLCCQMGIGLHCGQVLHGFIGGSDRLEFRVVGEAVSKAARYCTAADPGEILISPSLYQRVYQLIIVEQKIITTKHEGEWTAYRVSSM